MLEKREDIMKIICHQSASNSNAVPPNKKPDPDSRQEINPIVLVTFSPGILEKVQESSGQVIPGFSSYSLAQCPAYK